MATFTDRLAILITANAKGAASEIAGFGTTTEAEMTKAETATGRLGQAVTGLVPGLSNVGAQGLSTSKIIGIGIAGAAVVGGAALTKFAVDGVSQFEDATAEVRQLQRTIGGTTEDASKLRFAGKALGIDLGVLARGAGILEKSIGNGTSKLKDYGVEIAHDKQGNTDFAATIGNIAQAYQAADDPATKAAIGNAAFGRSYQELIPLLSKSREELTALYTEAGQEHQIFSAQDAEQGRQLSLATRELKTEVTGLEIELARALVPAFKDAANTGKGFLQILDALVKKANEGGHGDNKGAPALFDGISTVFKKAAYNAGVLSGGLRQLGSDVPVVGKQFRDTSSPLEDYAHHVDEATQASHRAAKGTKDEGDSATITAAEVKKLAKAEQDRADAAEGRVDANYAFATSLRAQADAEDDYREKLKAANDAGGKNADANKALGDSLFALKGQTIDTAKAAEAYALAQAGPDFSAQEKATLGHNAYRDSLLATATNGIPAVRQQALLLLAQLDAVNAPRAPIRVDLDISSAEYKLGILHQKFDSLQNAMGLIGPSRS